MYGVLVPVKGGDDIPLKKEELTLGRNDSNDIVLRFGSVSGKHCRLVLSNGYWYVIDLKSSNGTRLNGLRVSDSRVDPDAKIAFANYEYVLRYDPKANGYDGSSIPDFYETDVLGMSLFESAGLGKLNENRRSDQKKRPLFTKEQAENGSLKKDYSDLTIDDLKFDR